jgi:hypothetical protein
MVRRVVIYELKGCDGMGNGVETFSRYLPVRTETK